MAGFVAKWYVFSAAIRADHYALAIVGVLTSVVSVFFYLRVVVVMFMTERPEGDAPAAPARSAVVALALSAIALLYLGVLPARVMDIAASSIAGLF
jgi:NADH-quinone oxidoreductase subunit N